VAGLNLRIGIFGGTFDPPHLGHLILAAEAKDQLNLDRLLWVLTPDPPHKKMQRLTPVEIRFRLVEASLKNDDSFELSRVDLDRPGPHYTLDTVRIVANRYPEEEIFYIIGGDSLSDFPNWYKASELLATVSGLGVMRRPGDQIDLDDLDDVLPGIKEKVCFVDAPLLEISSHEIRKRIQESRPYRYYLKPDVYELIENENLYSNPSDQI
jgi:nicotinate-nucleotide adenylyltransferase